MTRCSMPVVFVRAGIALGALLLCFSLADLGRRLSLSASGASNKRQEPVAR